MNSKNTAIQAPAFGGLGSGWCAPAALLITFLTGLPTAMAQTAQAQAAAQAEKPERVSAARTIEEVVVTARRREESLQETPISLSALSGDYLDEMGVSSVGDIETLTPNLQFSQTNYKAPAIFIRGIGQKSGNPVLDPGVGIYLNNIYIPRSDAQLLDAVDVANIQVLRGPQGTLFGKNNIGGALLVDSRKPNAEAYEWSVEGELGSYGRKNLKLNGNIPLIEDELGLRFAANVKRSDGYIKNVVDDNGLFDEDRQALSMRAIWYASDVTEWDVFTFFSRVDERGSPYNCHFQNPDAIITQGFFRGEGGQDIRTQCEISEALAEDFKVSMTPGDMRYQIDNQLFAVTMRTEWGGVSVESITSYAEQDNIHISGDADGTSIAGVHVGPGAGTAVFNGSDLREPQQNRNQFTQEFKFNGTLWDDRINYTYGVFYAREELDNALDGNDVGDNGLVAVGPQSAGLPPGIPVPNDQGVLPVQANTLSSSYYLNETRAVFGQFTWSMTDYLQLTLGVRYTEEDRSSDYTQFLPDYTEYGNRLNAQIGTVPGVVQPVNHVQDGIYSPVPLAQYFAYLAPRVPFAALPELSGSTTFSEVTPVFTLNYIATDTVVEALNLDSLITYFTYSDGFKSGGLDVRSTNTGSTLQQFEPELVTNVEIGVKIDAFDKRLRFNAAVYQLDYENLQVAQNEVGATETEVVQFTGNAGSAVVDGFEMELTLLLGDWTINANAGYIDGDYVDYELGSNTPDGFAVIDRASEPFAQVPQNVRGVVVQYDMQTQRGRVQPQLQYYYSDESYIGSDYLSIEFDNSTISQYETFNARVLWEPNDRWQLNGYINNLKDDQHFIGGIAVTSVIGVANRVPGAPRQYGIGFKYRIQ